eukprot:COSAG05_NODE_1578_length_4501_cov_2.007269_7_plen_69_part_01
MQPLQAQAVLPSVWYCDYDYCHGLAPIFMPSAPSGSNSRAAGMEASLDRSREQEDRARASRAKLRVMAL